MIPLLPTYDKIIKKYSKGKLYDVHSVVGNDDYMLKYRIKGLSYDSIEHRIILNVVIVGVYKYDTNEEVMANEWGDDVLNVKIFLQHRPILRAMTNFKYTFQLKIEWKTRIQK
jgi:hypothetical protein